MEPSLKTVPEVTAELGFSMRSEIEPGRNRRGLLRATTRPLDSPFERQFEKRTCTVVDWSAPGAETPDLLRMGFEAIDLSGDGALQALLGDVRRAGEIDRDQAREVRRRLRGRVFPLACGKRLKFLNVAGEGLIVRKGGPNGLKPNPGERMEGMNGHDVAVAVHGDQDVYGTPLKQIMRGFAPWLFRHQSPDGRNRFSPLMLVNLWVPLQQVTRPLALMDRRTLDAREQQLQYALPTETFLERDEAMRFNDIWAFLHDDAQRWHFRADMTHEQAYVFDTLGEPHGAFSVPGEAVAEQLYRLLERQLLQVEEGRAVESAPAAMPALPRDTPLPLRAAVARMLEVARAWPGRDNPAAVSQWRQQAALAMDSVVRKSLEMRVVAVLLPAPLRRRRASR